MVTRLDKLAYGALQSARVAWYMGHYFASSRYRETNANDDVRRERPRSQSPGMAVLLKDLAQLFATDLANVEAGFYPMPRDDDGGFASLLGKSKKFFDDLPISTERKEKRDGREVYSEELAEKLPSYFLQNFHYQTGGYLTQESAELYDTQVEILFSGSANAMRRQCLVPLAQFMAGRDQRQIRLLDVACGTGRFLRFVKQSYPRMAVTGSDLSDEYLLEAENHLAPYQADFIPANGEKLPFADASFDVVSSIYLFHEVPPKVRRVIALEFFRVLKPGGRLIFMDSLQIKDRDDFEGLLQMFPLNFHEPYYASYTKENLAEIFTEAGFSVADERVHFLSKMMVADKV